MKRINVYITDEQHRAIKQAALKKGLKFSEVLRRALDDWMELVKAVETFSVTDKERSNDSQELQSPDRNTRR